MVRSPAPVHRGCVAASPHARSPHTRRVSSRPIVVTPTLVHQNMASTRHDHDFEAEHGKGIDESTQRGRPSLFHVNHRRSGHLESRRKLCLGESSLPARLLKRLAEARTTLHPQPHRVFCWFFRSFDALLGMSVNDLISRGAIGSWKSPTSLPTPEADPPTTIVALGPRPAVDCPATGGTCFGHSWAIRRSDPSCRWIFCSTKTTVAMST